MRWYQEFQIFTKIFVKPIDKSIDLQYNTANKSKEACTMRDWKDHLWAAILMILIVIILLISYQVEQSEKKAKSYSYKYTAQAVEVQQECKNMQKFMYNYEVKA